MRELRGDLKRGTEGSPGRVIVVGLDGSRASWDAFSWAVGEATRTRGRLVVVNVTAPDVDLAAIVGLSVEPAIEEAMSEIAEELEGAARQRADDVGVPLAFVRAFGSTARELVRVAEVVRGDLIVIGRPAKPIHPLAGSVGRRLVARGDAPIVVVVP